jgi:hypothetical protein
MINRVSSFGAPHQRRFAAAAQIRMYQVMTVSDAGRPSNGQRRLRLEPVRLGFREREAV